MVTKTTKKPAVKRTTVRKRIEAAVGKLTKRTVKKAVQKKPAVTKKPLEEKIVVETIKVEAPKPVVPATLTDTVIKLPVVNQYNPNMGCDPEFFFKLDGIVVGAEKVFKKDGLMVSPRTTWEVTDSKFIIDGVQAELNPKPNTCRANLANEIARCFIALKKEMAAQGKGLSIDMARSIVVPEAELASLAPDNQKLGCMPSKSVYAPSGIKLAEIDGAKHLQRSAGGHIHIGNTTLHKDADKVVQMLDLICGNTAVLVDRDEGNKERRKLYGRAGEYRLPKHGLEYRTLSNFWLESYPLMSFAFGMARLAIELVTDRTNGDLFTKAFLERSNPELVQQAINENDFDLALHNFKRIEPLIADVTHNPYGGNEHFALQRQTLPAFHFFIDTVKEKGLKHFFPQDTLTHWTSLPECHQDGFHWFLSQTVPKMMKAKV